MCYFLFYDIFRYFVGGNSSSTEYSGPVLTDGLCCTLESLSKYQQSVQNWIYSCGVEYEDTLTRHGKHA